MPSPLYTIESITTEDGVSSLQEDWSRLSRTAERPNVFTTYDWFRTWNQRMAQEAGPRRRPHVLVLKRNGAARGIVPFICMDSTRFGLRLRRLQFVSREHEWDYNDLVVGEDVAAQTEAVAEYFNRTSNAWDLIDLRDVRETGDAITHIRNSLTRAGLLYRLFPEEERSPYMPIDGPWSEMIKRHSRYTRREYRRFIEATSDGLRVRIVENPQQEPELLAKMIAVEAQKRVAGRPTVPFLGAYREVFQSLFDTLGSQGWISVVLLEWKDRLVAWQLCYCCGRKLWGYLTAYDHDFSSLSPGTILVSAAVDYGFSHGYDEFDFMNGEETYKLRWASRFHQTYRLLIWNRRWLSRLRAFRNLRALSSVSAHDE